MTLMATDATTAARSLLRQGLDPDAAAAALREAGYADNEAGDAVRAAAADPGGPADGTETVNPADSAAAARDFAGGRTRDARAREGRGRERFGGPRQRAPRTRAGRAVGRVESSFDRAAREAGRISLTPPKRVTARDGAGFLFGLFGYVLVLQYLRHGGDGVKGWLAAKFVNKPWTPPGDTEPAAGGGGGGLTTTRPAPPVAV